MHVEVDGEVVNDVDRPVLMVAIGNGGNVGGGTELTPDADTEDGQLDVMISHAVDAARQDRLRRSRSAAASTTTATTCVLPRVAGDGHRRRVLALRRR